MINGIKSALRKAGLKPRSLYQTRHAFAALMVDAGELPGWVQNMMDHETLKRFLERNYSYTKKYSEMKGLRLWRMFTMRVWSRMKPKCGTRWNDLNFLHQNYTKEKSGG